MKLLVSVIVLSSKLSIIVGDCTDIYGKSITPNAHFIPGPDICQLCVCDNTSPKWCKRVLCSPPLNCKSFVMGTSCCDYSCLDTTLPNGEMRDEIADRRFLITVATAFLILTILLFVIHKLRHRAMHGQYRGHLQTRPITEDRRNIGSIGFITGNIGYLNLPNAHHFDDHPIVHFPIYKPNGYYPRGEAPPPYEEAISDARLASYAEIEIIANERNMHDRRRTQMPYQPRIIDANGNCISESRPGGNGVFVNDPVVSDNYGALPLHRTIPMPLCMNADHVNVSTESTLTSIGPNNRYSTLHKKSNEFDNQRIRANSTNQRRSSRPNIYPPQFHLAVASLADVAVSQTQHRTLPLSASLSSPLPSTSTNNQCQFPGVILGPTSSSVTNICSLSSDDNLPAPDTSSTKKHHHRTCKKASQPATETNETPPGNVKPSKERKMCKASKELPHCGEESTEEGQEACPIVEDYYAECENCNLNVGADGCDGSDEYFSKQETMTLQRKLHEVSALQTLDKVSLTLPTNSRTRRCSSKNRKCGMWNAKESAFKTTLEYVSSESELEEEVVGETKSQELSEAVQKNADENVNTE